MMADKGEYPNGSGLTLSELRIHQEKLRKQELRQIEEEELVKARAWYKAKEEHQARAALAVKEEK